MKNIISLVQIVCIMGCMLINFSCFDPNFLERKPPAVLSDDLLYNANGVRELLIGAYLPMVGGGIFGSAMGTDWTYGSGASDDMYKGSEEGDQNNFNFVEKWTCLPSNAYMNERWRDCFGGVARTNTVLEFLDATQKGETPITDDKLAKQYEAEAKFLRAWYHFAANQVFKNIPYVRTPDEQGGKKADEIPNTDAGWSGIEEDLKFAIGNCLDSHPAARIGAPTTWSAKALLAKAYMYQNKLAEAKTLLDDIINNGGFTLVAKYFDNYNEDTENNSESIFELQCATSGTSTSSLRLTIATGIGTAGSPANRGTWGFYQASQNLVNAFTVDDDGLPILHTDPAEANNLRPIVKHDNGVKADVDFEPDTRLLDPRLDWTVARRGVDFNGWGLFPGQTWIRDQGNGGPYMSKKFMHFKSTDSRQAGAKSYNDRNFRYLRLAHIMLWRAEIHVEDGELEKAIELVNKIRTRAANPAGFVLGKTSAKRISTAGEPMRFDKMDGANEVWVVDASLVNWTLPAANYKVEPYPAGHAVFTDKALAREAVRMEIRLEFASEGQRFFDLRRWGQGAATPDYDVKVLNAFVTDDLKFRGFMTGAVYSAKKRYFPIYEQQLDIHKILEQDPDYR